MKSLIIILLAFFFIGCGDKKIPSNMVGNWNSEKVSITVRTERIDGSFRFTSDSVIVKLSIKSNNNTADGFIGSAEFVNARIKKNWGNLEKKGIAYKIKCGSVGKIFEHDPLDNKEVEIYLGPLKGNAMDSELRYTQGGSHFPMAGMIFTKEEK